MGFSRWEGETMTKGRAGGGTKGIDRDTQGQGHTHYPPLPPPTTHTPCHPPPPPPPPSTHNIPIHSQYNKQFNWRSSHSLQVDIPHLMSYHTAPHANPLPIPHPPPPPQPHRNITVTEFNYTFTRFKFTLEDIYRG